MISSYKKTPQQSKKRQLNTYLLQSINKNLSSIVDSNISNPLHIENKTSIMSTLAADLRAGTVKVPLGNTKSVAKPPMEAVEVNSIIYSKPSFCMIAVGFGDFPFDNKTTKNTTKQTNGFCPNNIFQNKSYCTSAMDSKQSSMNVNKAPCLAGLTLPPSVDVGNDAKVYRMCTTINGSVHHQISDMCDNIFAMAKFCGVTNNNYDDDSFIEFSYGDDDYDGDDGNKDDDDEVDNDEDDDDDDDDDDDGDDEDEYDEDEYDYNDEDDDDDENDVVDFSYDCPIEPAPKFNCDKKKVRFNMTPTVHVMRTWNYAYRAARKGEWMMYARDRKRFKFRIQTAATILNPILESEHRQKIYEQRFANLYDKDENDQQKETQNDLQSINVAKIVNPVGAMNISQKESKNIHQKKKRRKRRFCKMGNKHYF